MKSSLKNISFQIYMSITPWLLLLTVMFFAIVLSLTRISRLLTARNKYVRWKCSNRSAEEKILHFLKDF